MFISAFLSPYDELFNIKQNFKMKKYMPLNGLRWSRDSGSALCDTSQNSRSRTGWGGDFLMLFFLNAPHFFLSPLLVKTFGHSRALACICCTCCICCLKNTTCLCLAIKKTTYTTYTTSDCRNNQPGRLYTSACRCR